MTPEFATLHGGPCDGQTEMICSSVVDIIKVGSVQLVGEATRRAVLNHYTRTANEIDGKVVFEHTAKVLNPGTPTKS